MTWHFRSDDAPDDPDDQSIFGVAHYFLYWKVPPAQLPDIAQHMNTSYAASNALRRVKPGDVLWIITVQNYKLFLLGRLKVEFVVDDTAIAQDLVDPQQDTWHEADWYAISNKYNVEPMRNLNITHLAEHIRFVSRVSEMLDVQDGRIEANQLTNLRQLTAHSAQLLDDVWYNDAYTPQSLQDFLELTEDDDAYAEGKVVVRTVKQRRRNRRLVASAKSRFRNQHDGRLFCEVCGFDFQAVYGVDYIEAHHTEPIAALNTETENTVEDVVMLCANCHRVAHTRTPPYTVTELRQMFADDGTENNAP